MNIYTFAGWLVGAAILVSALVACIVRVVTGEWPDWEDED